MRERLILASLTLSSVLLLSACSDNDQDSTATVPAQSAPVAATTAQESLLENPVAAEVAATPAVPPVVAEANVGSSLPRVLESFGVGDNVFVRSLAVDPIDKAIWVGTSAGVLEIDLDSYDLRGTYSRSDGLANEYVFSIMVDSQGSKWFGTNGGGMTRYRDGEWKTFFPMHGLADYWVYSFGESKDGNLWVGTWGGANQFDSTNDKFTATYVKELVNEWVYGIASDDQGRMWLATEGGISMFDGTSWHGFTHEDGVGAPNMNNLPVSQNTGLGTRERHDLSVMTEGQQTYNPGYVFSVYVANDGNVWAGTWGGGVSVYDGTTWQSLTTNDGLAGDVVYSITQDAEGVFWFGTNKGLSRYDGKAWQTFSRGGANGLIDDNVYAVVAHPSGEVWAGTRGGVTRLGYGQ
jgi:ligand-binding sensor domain-containing protein